MVHHNSKTISVTDMLTRPTLMTISYFGSIDIASAKHDAKLTLGLKNYGTDFSISPIGDNKYLSVA